LDQNKSGKNELFWSEKELEGGKCYLWRTGCFHLWVKRINDEFYIASEISDGTGCEEIPAVGREVEYPDQKQWGRWIIRGQDNTVRLAPVMPDRPVVIRPTLPVRIPGSQNGMFYIIIPSWVKISAGRSGETVLCERATDTLSNTWFGDPVSGELCYSLSTDAVRTMEECPDRADMIICPVMIKNEYSEELNIDRICVRTNYLSIFLSGTRLITNTVEVIYNGEENLTTVKYGKKAPSMPAGVKKLADPRSPAESMMKKTFSSFVSQTFN